ncbi:carbohydrate kinase family protein [Robertkochia solimangrovi]|uniref:carbohydrate kinase family protein n=1 Tax=Robertkochia solimangrovi TaxID=2213046 RepID=UPI00117DF4DD|nr:carbohydrate kinase family protein [Robertkochia solimangrovi]TRZ41856.1 carbohydrate kinase family protein [Robertkochia solimangrovi]
MRKKELFVVGELNADLILNNIHGFPEIGTEIIADHMNLVLGSSSGIMASNAASMGTETTFCGMIGYDIFGDLVLRELKKKGVVTDFIKRTETLNTGVTVVMSYDQDRANVTHCGAMEALTFQDIPWEEVAKHKHFHLSNFFLQKGIKTDIIAIFKKAKETGVTTSLDMQWDPGNTWDFDFRSCLPYVDVFFPNEAEIKALTGSDSITEAITAVSPYANTIALKLGEQGSIGFTEDQVIKVKAFINPQFIDAIGAGDSFNAGFISKYISGAPLEFCLQYGNIMGALNTTAAGGTAAFQNKDQIQNRIRELFDPET